MKNRLTQMFVSAPPAPMIGPLDAANCYLPHVLLFLDEIPGMKRADHRGGRRRFFIEKTEWRGIATRLRAHSRRRVLPPARVPSRCTGQPR